jgi:segregation and condensation protein A
MMAELTKQYMAYAMMRVDQLSWPLVSTHDGTTDRDQVTHAATQPKNRRKKKSTIRAPNWCDVFEYEQIKKAAMRLNELPQAERDFAVIQVWMEQTVAQPLPNINLDDLRHAWVTILARAKINRHHQVKRETLSVRAYMSQILRDLRGQEQVQFYDLFSPTAPVAEVVVTFWQSWIGQELLVEISQSQAF